MPASFYLSVCLPCLSSHRGYVDVPTDFPLISAPSFRARVTDRSGRPAHSRRRAHSGRPIRGRPTCRSAPDRTSGTKAQQHQGESFPSHGKGRRFNPTAPAFFNNLSAVTRSTIRKHDPTRRGGDVEKRSFSVRRSEHVWTAWREIEDFSDSRINAGMKAARKLP